MFLEHRYILIYVEASLLLLNIINQFTYGYLTENPNYIPLKQYCTKSELI